MADGLLASNNLSDVASVDKSWDNLGAGVTFTVSGTSYNINVTGEDIIQLSGAHLVNNEDFFQLRNISSPVQPRLNTVAAFVASGYSLETTRLDKHQPTSSGTYILSEGALSGTSVQVNGVAIGSLGGSPFVASGAISPIYVNQLKLTSDLRGADTFGSGVLASGTKGVPIEYRDLILYIRTENV